MLVERRNKTTAVQYSIDNIAEILELLRVFDYKAVKIRFDDNTIFAHKSVTLDETPHDLWIGNWVVVEGGKLHFIGNEAFRREFSIMPTTVERS